jgi:hypothetical protein
MNRKFLLSFAPLLVIAAFALPSMAQASIAHPLYYKNNSLIPVNTKVAVVAWGKLALKPVTSKGNEFGCRNVVGAYVENKGATEATAVAEGETQAFGTYECESPGTCPTETTGLIPETAGLGLPWRSHLLGEPTTLNSDGQNGVIRSESTGVDVLLGCAGQLTGTTEEGVEDPVFNPGTYPPTCNPQGTQAEQCFESEKLVLGEQFEGANCPLVGGSTLDPEHGTGAANPGFSEFTGQNSEPESGKTCELHEESEVKGTGVTLGHVDALGFKAEELISAE